MKVTIAGEVFDFNPEYKPLAEALALEAGLKIPYVQYEEGLRDGSARSVAAFIWLVWKRNGRDVPLGDILSGAVDIDLNTLEVDDEAAAAGPTSLPPPASSTTGGGTSERSPKSSTSAPGKSAG